MSKLLMLLSVSIFFFQLSAQAKEAETAGEKFYLLSAGRCNEKGITETLSSGVDPNVTQNGKTAADLIGESRCSPVLLEAIFQKGFNQEPRFLGGTIERLIQAHPCSIQPAKESCDPRMLLLFDEILKKGADVNTIGFTNKPLLITTLNSCRYCFNALLLKGADPNLSAGGSLTPLETLLHQSYRDFWTEDARSMTFRDAELLINAGANVNYTSKPSALCYALGISTKLLNLLDKNGIAYTGSHIHCAAGIYLRNSNVDPNGAPLDPNSYEFLNRVRTAHSRGLDLSLLDPNDENVLIKLIDDALFHGFGPLPYTTGFYISHVSELIRLGANPVASNSRNGTAIEFFLGLLKKDSFNLDNMRILLFKSLITKNAVSYISKEGDSILMQMLRKWPYETRALSDSIQQTIDLGIDLSIKNAQAETAYSIAMKRGFVDSAWLIVKNGGK